MRTLVILGIFIVNIHSLSAQKLVPTNFLFRSLAVGNTDSTVNNMRSNVITEIILKEDLQTNSTSVWLGTGLGVSVIIDSDTVEIYSFRVPVFGPGNLDSELETKTGTFLWIFDAVDMANTHSNPDTQTVVVVDTFTVIGP